MDKRMTMPQYMVHTPSFCMNLLDKVNIMFLTKMFNPSWQVYEKRWQSVLSQLETDDPQSVWLAMDGWSAITTGYIGAEICKFNMIVKVATSIA